MFVCDVVLKDAPKKLTCSPPRSSVEVDKTHERWDIELAGKLSGRQRQWRVANIRSSHSLLVGGKLYIGALKSRVWTGRRLLSSICIVK